MSFNCKLLVKRDFDINDWVNEYNKLYEEFKKEYIEAGLKFKEIEIRFKRKPLVNERYNSFYHITTGHDVPNAKDEDRIPDTKRIEKFYYPKAMILNYNCDLKCPECSGMKVWFEDENSVKKAYIYFDEAKYIVILEHRKNEIEEYFLFKTAFYVEYLRTRESYLKRYEKNKNNTL